MSATRARRGLRGLALGAGIVAASGAAAYSAYVINSLARYGSPRRPPQEEADSLLDRYVPSYDVVERHRIRVGAPADVTLAASKEMDLFDMPLVQAIFRGRELIMRSRPEATTESRGMLEATLALGWVVLEEVPGRQVVVGAVTKPWEADVTFRGLPPDDFAHFDEPGWVKIAWTLRADPDGDAGSTFRTETRAVATDAYARNRFRPYWAFLSPGIILIRKLSLRPLKAEAERRARASVELTTDIHHGRER